MGGVSFGDITRQYFSRETITFELRLLCRKIEIWRIQQLLFATCWFSWRMKNRGELMRDGQGPGMAGLLRTQGPRAWLNCSGNRGPGMAGLPQDMPGFWS